MRQLRPSIYLDSIFSGCKDPRWTTSTMGTHVSFIFPWFVRVQLKLLNLLNITMLRATMQGWWEGFKFPNVRVMSSGFDTTWWRKGEPDVWGDLNVIQTSCISSMPGTFQSYYLNMCTKNQCATTRMNTREDGGSNCFWHPCTNYSSYHQLTRWLYAPNCGWLFCTFWGCYLLMMKGIFKGLFNEFIYTPPQSNNSPQKS